jgi:hypothetical protein
MSGRIVLHAGTHKTGTTSIQTFLRDENSTLLAAVGCHYPDGFLLRTVHTHLPLLVIQPNRMWPARIRFPETQRASWQEAAWAFVREQVAEPEHETLVYAHEDLSYVRSDGELERLRELFDGREVTVAIALRDRLEFLASYRSQLAGTGFEPSDDPTSFAYVEADTWLVDYEGLVDGYRRWFGSENVVTIDYGDAMEADGSIIPAFTDVLGIERAALPRLDPYRLNQAGSHIRLTDDQLEAVRRDLATRFP